MKTKMKHIMFAAMLCFGGIALFAQSVTDSAAVPAVAFTLPEAAAALIALLTPLIITGIKLVVPKIKTALIPVLAPVIGAILTIATYYSGHLSLGSDWKGILIGTLLGCAGVGVRELYDQLTKKPEPTPPPATD
jgi:hypothetical protein